MIEETLTEFRRAIDDEIPPRLTLQSVDLGFGDPLHELEAFKITADILTPDEDDLGPGGWEQRVVSRVREKWPPLTLTIAFHFRPHASPWHQA